MTAPASLSAILRPLPELELEVMKALWRLDRAAVGEVQEELKPRRPLAYTTVMTVLERLTRKRAATRSKQGRGYVYRPALSREAAREIALARLLADHFGGSFESLENYLAGRRRSARGARRQAASAGAARALDSALL